MGNISQTASLKLIFSIYKLLPAVQIKKAWTHDHSFYVDIDTPKAPPPEVMALIETEMGSIEAIDFREMMGANAATLFNHHGQSYFSDQMTDQGSSLVTIAQYKKGYAPATSEFLEEGVYKILGCTSVEEGIRISGVAASDKQKLKKILKKIESGKEIDYRKLGEEQDLFFQADSGYLFTQRGSQVYETLVTLWRSLNQPYLTHSTGELTQSHAAIFNHMDPSEVELPLILAELHQESGNNNFESLLNSSSFTQDSTHIFTSETEAVKELTSSLLFMDKTFMMLGLEVQWHLTEESQTFTGTQTSWSQGVQKLRNALQAANFQWEPRSFDHDTHGPAAYITIPDAIGQRWEVGTLAINIATPNDLKLKYRGTDNLLHTPIMIKRSLFFSVERIIALQLENNNGLLPTWLAAEQVRILPIAERHKQKAQAVLHRLKAAGIRANIDLTADPLSTKIHAAETAKVPRMIVLGDQEVQNDSLAVRRCGDPKPKTGVDWEPFLSEIVAETKIPSMEQTGAQRVKLES